MPLKVENELPRIICDPPTEDMSNGQGGPVNDRCRVQQENIRNARLSRTWDKEMMHAKSSRYKNVAGILISWDGKCDDLNTEEEVSRLKKVLEERYNFKMHNKRLKDENKNAQVQVNKYLADFVYDEDGKNTLLIVYYAGHGIPGYAPGQLVLAGRRLPKEEGVLNHVVWSETEALLKHTESDVLVIFDCCFAGYMGRNGDKRSWSSRCFEFLGATGPDSKTPQPGKSSFTSALVWALEKLADEPGEFSTFELKTKITEAPDFPKDQFPVLNERHEPSWKKIVIAPLPAAGEEQPSISTDTSDSPPDDIVAYLDLRLLLKEQPTEQHIITMATALKYSIKFSELSVEGVAWGGLYSTDSPRYDLPNIVQSVLNKWYSRTLRSRSNSSVNIARSAAPVSDETVLTSVREAHDGTSLNVEGRYGPVNGISPSELAPIPRPATWVVCYWAVSLGLVGICYLSGHFGVFAS